MSGAAAKRPGKPPIRDPNASVQMNLNDHIFRQYDIRGVVGEDLSAEVAKAIGRALGSELRSRNPGEDGLVTVVGRDNRPSSPELADAAMTGLQETGVDVIDVGTVPTPTLYFAEIRFDADAGLQITGSHNPPEYNGFKMVIGGRALYGDAIVGLRRRIVENDLSRGAGDRRREDALAPYVADIGARFSLKRPVKVVADCGNGVGSLVVPEVLRAIGAEVVPLYCESDGSFPNHHPDPTVDENVADLIATVRAEGADLGVGFDGDADRLGAVDEAGNIIRGDLLLLLFGLDALAEGDSARKMVFDVKCSQAVAEVYAAAGGEPIMWKTGHSLIKEKMREEGAAIAGELSGHFCFADSYYGFDDAPYAACRLADLVARSGRPISLQVADFPEYVSTPEIRVPIPEEAKFGIVSEAVEHFSRGHEVIAVDGARVLYDDGWGLLRASNTQPVLVLRFEARDEMALGRIRDDVMGWLKKRGVEPPTPPY